MTALRQEYQTFLVRIGQADSNVILARIAEHIDASTLSGPQRTALYEAIARRRTDLGGLFAAQIRRDLDAPPPSPPATPSGETVKSIIDKPEEAKAGTQEENPLVGVAAKVVPALREAQARETALLPRFHADALAGILDDQRAVRDTLRHKLTAGIHYGAVPGIQGEMLFEAGADTILPAYHCRATPAPSGVAFRDVGDEHIAVTVIADVVRWDTGEIVASGIGAASTREIKYAYRWVHDGDPALKDLDKSALKTRVLNYGKDAGKTQWRAPNPDLGDLENTVVKMAFKRAKVDAVQALPGVAGLFKQEERK
jgi:hypothetical protein